MLDGVMLLWWILTVPSFLFVSISGGPPRVAGPQVGLRNSDRIHRPARGVLLRARLSRTASRRAREIRRGPLASSARLHDALRRRRWNRHHRRGRDRRRADAALLAGLSARIRAGLRLRVGLLSGVRHAGRRGRVIPEVAADDVPA